MVLISNMSTQLLRISIFLVVLVVAFAKPPDVRLRGNDLFHRRDHEDDRIQTSKRNRFQGAQNQNRRGNNRGFNANLNRNDEYPSDFGNVAGIVGAGDVGGGGADEGTILKISRFLNNLSENDIAKYLYYGITSLVNRLNSKHKGSAMNSDYFFDFRHIYMPTDRSSSSEESSADESGLEKNPTVRFWSVKD